MLFALQNIYKEYPSPEGNLSIFHDMSWNITHPAFVSIQGRSGSGKSTLFNLIAALDQNYKGTIYLDSIIIKELKGQALSHFRTHDLGLIFQMHYLLEDLNVLENVLLPALIAGEKKETYAKKLLDEVELSHRLFHHPSELSGGERQRAAIARALINDPRLLLADEPTGNLDDKSAQRVQKLLRELSHEKKKLLLLVTHDSQWAQEADIRLELLDRQLKFV